jgi:cyclopropane-fatty-acyl-phospholipid synthase
MTVASKLEPLLSRVFDGASPVRVRAWDGSETGPSEGPVLVLRSRRALRHLLWRTGEPGLARAYVSGDLDVEGDLTETLRTVWAARPSVPRMRAALLAVRLRALPTAAGRTAGRANGPYDDVPPAFHELLLDGSMAYSCAYFDDDDLDTAQRGKLGLVCRELGLHPGMRLLDLDCGWGALAMYAAVERGVRVTGITLSEEQAAYTRARAEDLPVEVRVESFRETGGVPYDAVASVEMGERLGAADYPVFAAKLFSLVRPGGSVLIQQVSRPAGSAPDGGPFVGTYLAPGAHLLTITETVGLLQEAGLEVQRLHGLREDYARTAAAWSRNLEARWDDAVKLLGEEAARAWRLHLAAGALAFEEGLMGVEQIHAVRPKD